MVIADEKTNGTANVFMHTNKPLTFHTQLAAPPSSSRIALALPQSPALDGMALPYMHTHQHMSSHSGNDYSRYLSQNGQTAPGGVGNTSAIQGCSKEDYRIGSLQHEASSAAAGPPPPRDDLVDLSLKLVVTEACGKVLSRKRTRQHQHQCDQNCGEQRDGTW
ncbi:hypothetical protein ISN44_As11g033280 [Arabidopsis suecica]|uniref:Uncharacterized protein n=1 Tax=Arabidopsis suecica TaxID=45249 RepID=A0A8T1ZEC2_ARASU|nr:hypothetical protein ISN44_As11g033280 [Arabidopsis suecica]